MSLQVEVPDLGSLFRLYGTDKDLNGYTSLYETLFLPRRENIRRFLEIGIGTLVEGVVSSMASVWYLPNYRQGASLRAWRDFFPNASIVGIDPQPDTQFSDEDRIRTVLGDSRDAKVAVLLEEDGPFDVILDDGIHDDVVWLQNLANFYPLVRDGGLYIIEDINPESRLCNDPLIVREVVGHHHFFFALRESSVCVIQKRSNAPGETPRTRW